MIVPSPPAAKVEVIVPATSANLGPGFDCLGLALGLYNELALRAVPDSPSRVSVEGEGAAELPRDGSHLSLRAADAVFQAAGLPPPAWELEQLNRIPLAAGLGSSAAAIAGGMVAANAFLPEPLPRERLLDLAAAMEGHPDNVAPALYGGLVIACREGERIRTLRLSPSPRLRLALAVPAFTLPTAEARRALPERVSRADAVFNTGRAAALVTALLAGQDDVLDWAADDRLHQPYRARLIPGAAEALAAARRAGARGAVISGAGPSILAFWLEDDNPGAGRAEAVCAAMAGAFAARGLRCRSFAPAVDGGGARLKQPGRRPAV